MDKNIFMFSYFKGYYYAECDAEREEIFNEFMDLIEKSNYGDFYTNKISVLDMIYDYKYIEKCNFTEEEFKLAIKSCLRKAFDKYVPSEEFEDGEYNENRRSSLGQSNEDLLLLYLGKHLFWYLVGWHDKYKSGRYVACKVCGNLLKKGNRTRNKKYCESCAKKVKLEQMRKANKKYYNSYKVKKVDNKLNTSGQEE